MGNINAEGSGLYSALSFVDENESIIITGKHEGEFKTSSDFGTNWIGSIHFKYSTASGDDYHNFPNHQDPLELSDYMYDGLSCLTRNPNNWGNTKTVWYLSGGAGGRKTAPSFSVDNYDFENARWQYTIKGQTMPVVYDVVFHDYNYNNQNKSVIFTPLSDWTLGWEYKQNINFNSSELMIPTPLKYDRKATEICEYDTYISNVNIYK